jgi:hypothetical protein
MAAPIPSPSNDNPRCGSGGAPPPPPPTRSPGTPPHPSPAAPGLEDLCSLTRDDHAKSGTAVSKPKAISDNHFCFKPLCACPRGGGGGTASLSAARRGVTRCSRCIYPTSLNVPETAEHVRGGSRISYPGTRCWVCRWPPRLVSPTTEGGYLPHHPIQDSAPPTLPPSRKPCCRFFDVWGTRAPGSAARHFRPGEVRPFHPTEREACARRRIGIPWIDRCGARRGRA